MPRPARVHGLTFNGEPQGVNRETGTTDERHHHELDPHRLMTRRGDDTNLTPIYLDGITRWTRDGNAFLLPVNNGGGSGGNSRTPGMTAANGCHTRPSTTRTGSRTRVSTARSTAPRSACRIRVRPSRRTSRSSQKNAAATLGFTHQMGDKLFFDVGANFTRTANLPVNHQLGMRTLAIDLNRTLPNGVTNPNYLQAYSQAEPRYYKRTTDNGAIRANAAYITDLGKLGNYTFSFTLGGNIRDTVHRQYIRSVALATDPREWAAQTLTMRYYLNSDFRSFIDDSATSLYDVLPLSGGNSGYTTDATVARGASTTGTIRTKARSAPSLRSPGSTSTTGWLSLPASASTGRPPTAAIVRPTRDSCRAIRTGTASPSATPTGVPRCPRTGLADHAPSATGRPAAG